MRESRGYKPKSLRKVHEFLTQSGVTNEFIIDAYMEFAKKIRQYYRTNGGDHSKQVEELKRLVLTLYKNKIDPRILDEIVDIVIKNEKEVQIAR